MSVAKTYTVEIDTGWEFEVQASVEMWEGEIRWIGLDRIVELRADRDRRTMPTEGPLAERILDEVWTAASEELNELAAEAIRNAEDAAAELAISEAVEEGSNTEGSSSMRKFWVAVGLAFVVASQSACALGGGYLTGKMQERFRDQHCPGSPVPVTLQQQIDCQEKGRF